MSELTISLTPWEQALIKYHAKEITREELRQYWQVEFECIFMDKVQPERMHHVDPLFKCGWSPADAAEHLTIVWALKRWEKNVTPAAPQP